MILCEVNIKIRIGSIFTSKNLLDRIILHFQRYRKMKKNKFKNPLNVIYEIREINFSNVLK